MIVPEPNVEVPPKADGRDCPNAEVPVPKPPNQ